MEPPQEFPFPFEPYDIQKGFMTKLYETLEEGKVGIFESPTGTGKSLSLICGALKWLQDHEDRQKREVEEILEGARPSSVIEERRKDSSTESTIPAAPDWVQQFAKKREAEERTFKSREEQEAKVKREARLQEIRKNNRAKFFSNKRKRKDGEKSEEEEEEEFAMGKDKTLTNGPIEKEEDEELLVDDYRSDEEEGSKQTRSEDEQEEEVHITKIYYCSRTHSQLAQFVREVQKSPFGKDVRVVSLGSRQNLCINDSVRKLGSAHLINDRCLEMQNNKKKEDSRGKGDDRKPKRRSLGAGCPFHQHIPTYSDEVLAEVRDIEQLVIKGRKMEACPYYGTRYSIPAAQLVALPYNTLLHKHTREVTGIKLAGNVVIIDEAHNLVDTITGIHSVEITGGQIARAYSQLTQYAQRYKSRLLAKNLRYIKQILHVLKHFIMCLGGKAGHSPEEPSTGVPKVHLQTINDFLFTAGMDNINLFKIQRYCEKSHISRKLNGFVEKYQPSVTLHTAADTKADNGGGASSVSKFLQQIKQGSPQQTGGTQESDTQLLSLVDSKEESHHHQSSSPFMHIEAFLLALTNADKDGRVVINKQARLSQSSLRFLLLNPALHFADIVQQARAVVMAGGTMQPVSEFKEHLLFAAGVEPQRITEFSCGHVIPACNLLPVALGSGPVGGAVDFSYEHRNKEYMMVELGRVLVNLCNLVPAGVCVFFPSYEYERQVYKFFEDSGVLKRLAVRKQVFREPKKASQVDQVLSDYSKCIQRCKSQGYKAMPLTGALLFSVVGGKMSEGINFSDDLGRCVVMVGLPYPNIKSPELKEKMDYLDATLHHPPGKSPGQIHYENLCMKAVNQSIGRAIRHKDDYATIVLLDRRYFRPHICSALPGWISSHLQTISKFGDAFGTIRKFFKKKSDLLFHE